jgi:hypothetical protein
MVELVEDEIIRDHQRQGLPVLAVESRLVFCPLRDGYMYPITPRLFCIY